MTLAEIRECLTRELANQVLAGGDPALVDQHALMVRVGRPLVCRHVKPRQSVQWRGAPYGDQVFVVERVEVTKVMFERPRLAFAMQYFLRAVLKGAATDA